MTKQDTAVQKARARLMTALTVERDRRGQAQYWDGHRHAKGDVAMRHADTLRWKRVDDAVGDVNDAITAYARAIRDEKKKKNDQGKAT